MTPRLLLLVPAVVLSASCTTSVNGNPTSDSSVPELPSRPRQLQIGAVDPCAALSPPQLGSLSVEYYKADAADGRRGPGCEWIHSPREPVETYTVDINTRGGVELVFGQPHLNVVTVEGFGAVETPGLLSSGDHDCVVNVDVAPGQALQVGYFYNGSTVPMTHEIACGKARHAAELAMQTILAKIGG